MKKLLIVAGMISLLSACMYDDHNLRAPSNAGTKDGGETKLHHCKVTNQHGMDWTRSDVTVDKACHRALMACRHWRGDVHHKHHPTKCVRAYYR